MSDLTKPAKGISLWLVLSLAANALLIGLVGGRMLAGEHHGRHGERRKPPEHTTRLRDTLSDQQMKDLRRGLVRAWRDSDEARTHHRSIIAEVRELALADEFDKAAMIEALARLRVSESELRARSHEVIAEQMAGLTKEQREATLSQIVDMWGGKRKRRDFDRDRPPPPPHDGRFGHDGPEGERRLQPQGD